MRFLFNIGKGLFWIAVLLCKAAFWAIVVVAWACDGPRRRSDDDDNASFFRHLKEGRLD